MDFKKGINRFFFVNYVLMLINLIGFAAFAANPNISSTLFIIAAMVAYAYIYLVPAGLLLGLLRTAMTIFRISEKLYANLFLSAIAVLTLTLTHLIIQVDRIIFKMYGFHFNGFVWNILTTEGGVESMGFDTAAYWTSTAVFLALIIVEVILLIACLRWESFKLSRISKLPHYLRIAMTYTAVSMFAVA